MKKTNISLHKYEEILTFFAYIFLIKAFVKAQYLGTVQELLERFPNQKSLRFLRFRWR